jgi:hypothetical protein
MTKPPPNASRLKSVARRTTIPRDLASGALCTEVLNVAAQPWDRCRQGPVRLPKVLTKLLPSQVAASVANNDKLEHRSASFRNFPAKHQPLRSTPRSARSPRVRAVMLYEEARPVTDESTLLPVLPFHDSRRLLHPVTTFDLSVHRWHSTH